MSFPVPTEEIMGESSLGFALRVAHENKYGAFSWVLKFIDATPLQLARAPEAVARFGVATRRPGHCTTIAMLDVDAGSRYYNGVLDRKVTHYGQSISLQLLDPASTSYCPHCLRESGLLRAVFCINVCTVCPEHRCAVIRKCACGAPITAESLFRKECRCKRSLLDHSSSLTYPNAARFWQAVEQKFYLSDKSSESTHPAACLYEDDRISLEDLLTIFAHCLYEEVPGFARHLVHFLRNLKGVDASKIAAASERASQTLVNLREVMKARIAGEPDPVEARAPLLLSVMKLSRPTLDWRLPPSLQYLQDDAIEQIEARRSRRERTLTRSDPRVTAEDRVMSAEDAGAMVGIKPDKAYGMFPRIGRATKWFPRRLVNACSVFDMIASLRRYAHSEIPEYVLEGVSVDEAGGISGAFGIRQADLLAGICRGEMTMWFDHQLRPALSTIQLDRAAVIEWCKKKSQYSTSIWLPRHKASALTLLDKATLDDLAGRHLVMKRVPGNLKPDEFRFDSLLAFLNSYLQVSRFAKLLRLETDVVVTRIREFLPKSAKESELGGSVFLAKKCYCEKAFPKRLFAN